MGDQVCARMAASATRKVSPPQEACLDPAGSEAARDTCRLVHEGVVDAEGDECRCVQVELESMNVDL